MEASRMTVWSGWQEWGTALGRGMVRFSMTGHGLFDGRSVRRQRNSAERTKRSWTPLWVCWPVAFFFFPSLLIRAVHKDSRRAGMESKQRKETRESNNSGTEKPSRGTDGQLKTENGIWLRNGWGGIPSVEVERGVWGRRVRRGPASGAPVRHASGVRDGGERSKREGKRRARRRRAGERE
ncbi:hypothetical protein BDW72DRAFT_127986 [Aspergillus terricola var. indicus]